MTLILLCYVLSGVELLDFVLLFLSLFFFFIEPFLCLFILYTFCSLTINELSFIRLPHLDLLFICFSGLVYLVLYRLSTWDVCNHFPLFSFLFYGVHFLIFAYFSFIFLYIIFLISLIYVRSASQEERLCACVHGRCLLKVHDSLLVILLCCVFNGRHCVSFSLLFFSNLIFFLVMLSI